MLKDYSLKNIATQLRNQALSAQALVEHCEAQYEKSEETLHAYKLWNGNQAKAIAKTVDSLIHQGYDLGPLMGIPTSIKDLYGINGLPTFAGTKEAFSGEWQESGPIVNIFEHQLSPIVGKTHTVEFAYGGLGLNPHWDTPRNPWDTTRIPGGSSSGAGVSLCQQSAFIALGTDTAGSVRIPASFTGRVGLKTTKGLWPTNNIVPLSTSLDTAGVLTNSVEDSAFVFNALQQSLHQSSTQILPLENTRITLGVPSHFFFDNADSSIAALFEETVQTLASKGIHIKTVDMPMCDDVFEVFKVGGLGAPELIYFIQTYAPEKLEQLDPIVRLRIKESLYLTAQEYLQRVATLENARTQCAPIFDDIDALIHPTVLIAPAVISSLADTEEYKKKNLHTLHNTCMANLLNLCALTMPMGKDSFGMPAGLQISCAPYQEHKLLAIALALENIIGKPAQILGTPSI